MIKSFCEEHIEVLGVYTNLHYMRKQALRKSKRTNNYDGYMEIMEYIQGLNLNIPIKFHVPQCGQSVQDTVNLNITLLGNTINKLIEKENIEIIVGAI